MRGIPNTRIAMTMSATTTTSPITSSTAGAAPARTLNRLWNQSSTACETVSNSVGFAR